MMTALHSCCFSSSSVWSFLFRPNNNYNNIIAHSMFCMFVLFCFLNCCTVLLDVEPWPPPPPPPPPPAALPQAPQRMLLPSTHVFQLDLKRRPSGLVGCPILVLTLSLPLLLWLLVLLLSQWARRCWRILPWKFLNRRNILPFECKKQNKNKIIHTHRVHMKKLERKKETVYFSNEEKRSINY